MRKASPGNQHDSLVLYKKATIRLLKTLYHIYTEQKGEGDKMKCKLSAQVNKCPYYLRDKQECLNENTCSFQEKQQVEEHTTYKREERWYEKYMK